jgi:hypothetical protein
MKIINAKLVGNWSITYCNNTPLHANHIDYQKAIDNHKGIFVIANLYKDNYGEITGDCICVNTNQIEFLNF